MRILAFDTATRATTVALLDAGIPGPAVQARDDPPPGQRPRHTTRLMPLIVDVLQRAGVPWGGVHRIAVGTGPGTFTGLRIGVATARGLAQALAIPLTGVSTLQSLARGAAASAAAPDARAVLAVIDARRGEAFAAAWPALAPADGGWAGGLGPQALAPQAVAPQELAGLAAQLGTRPLAVGDGALGFRAVLERAGAVVPEDRSELHRVDAVHHGRLALELATSPDSDAGRAGVLPDYLRRPDAELARRAAPPG